MTKSVRIIGRFDSSSGIGKHGWSFLKALTASENDINIEAVLTSHEILEKDLQALRDKGISVEPATRISGKSDFSIFCDVLGQADENLHAAGNINALYFVWDSSRIPKKFVDIIHKDFDFVLVPTSFVKDALINSGVAIDILILPLVVDVPKLMPNKNNNYFTFGFIGSYEDRKNVQLLIEAFSKNLGKVSNLRIHLTYSHKPPEEVHALIKQYENSNIHITFGEMKAKELNATLSEIDCFISLSMGEGYSFLPREYMHLERPVILSYSAAHKSIPKMDGLWFINSDIAYPAFYPQIDGRQHGVFHGPYLEDVSNALTDIWKEIEFKQRRPSLAIYARSLSAESLCDRYQTIFSPKGIIPSKSTSHISPDRCLTIKSDPLIAKYKLINPTNLRLNKHVVIANDGGFFSVFNRYVSILVHELEEDPNSLIIPDWRISSLTEHLGHSKFTSFCYGTPLDGNIFLKIFSAPFPIPLSYYEDADFLRDNAIIRTDYNEFKEPDLTYIHAYKLYKRKDFRLWREKYHNYFSRHINLRDDLQRKIKSFIREKFEDHYVISAHIRHPSHSMEQPGGRIPTVDVFKEIIDKQIEKASSVQDKPIKLFIASDQDSVIDYFRGYYPDILVTTHARRSSAEHDRVYQSANDSEKQKEGYQIQHIMASNSQNWSVQMADEVIVDAWLLAASNVFIHITSNVATAVSFINPKVSMIYCE